MKDVTIVATDLTKVYKDPSPFIAKLMDNTTPVSGRKIILTINGVNYERTTNKSGIVSLNINLIAGSYPITITFKGDSVYNPTSKQVIVKVVSNDVKQKPIKDVNHYFEVNKLPLKVLLKDGFATKMGHNIKETELLMDNRTMNSPTFFFNSGNSGIEFEVSVVIMKDYVYKNISFRDYLDNWSKYVTPVSVVTDALDVPNGKYVMKIESKKQTDKVKSIWKIRFKQFYENNMTFETLYTQRPNTYSAEDLILLKYDYIGPNSPKQAILALQKKLVLNGCWLSPYGRRQPTGVWDDDMPYDINSFENMAFGSNVRKCGICDRDVILALVENVYDYQSYIRKG